MDLSPLTAGTTVRLTKLSAENPGPLPTSYWLEGKLSADVVVGQPISALRYRRAGRHPGEPEVVDWPGLYESSPVVSLTPQQDGSVIAATRNSHWHVSAVATGEAANAAPAPAGSPASRI